MTKRKKFASGSLNTSTDGGVYFTDTSGSRKGRAETMQKLDTYIDEHGGTPKAPEQTKGKTRDGGGVTTGNVPQGYSSPKKSIPQATQDCLILGDNVPGMSLTVENKLELILIHSWEMVANG